MATNNAPAQAGKKNQLLILIVAIVVVLAVVVGGAWAIKSRQATANEANNANGDTVNIALVSRGTQGDFLNQWLDGANKEAKRIGANLHIYDAKGDDNQQILDVQSAVATKPDVILVDHSLEGVTNNVKAALDAGIPVVGFDSVVNDDRVVHVSQSDADLSKLITSQLVKDTNGKADVIYTYVAGFAPLDRRNAVWEKVKKANPGLNQVAQVGVVNEATAQQTAEQVKASLQANPNVTAVLAPYDEFAKGAAQAVDELGLNGKVKVYGVDISDADIAELKKDNSPWIATATTDPANDGAVSVRTAYLAAKGKLGDTKTVTVPPTLVTGDVLREKNITSLSQLVTAFPSLRTDDLSPVEDAAKQ
ncbi:substrate-binding domain-containing protein [Bifidobacterium miconisargentati]|uniref:substrate-binding domain-containing protein n=1 Tax=Bifidobacterium miconisargentati TaxID=2834437 RepID=UPI001BDC69F5|nr:substrate-binding domain-containing protein [Bifidobacterium miconisargentati]MBW3089696.1 substrate-binding domain-containing protein [Bifidobacterium miconisargentati]